MREKKHIIRNYKQMFLVITVFTLVLLVGGVSIAFFNYTRTGGTNTVKTGKINFTSSQNGTINLTNIFPIDKEETGIMDDTTKVGSIEVTVTGDTSYDKGVEYLISATNVNNTVGSKTIPISINAETSGTLGTSDDNYFDNRATATSHIYKVLAEDTISNNDQLMVGYIAKGQTGINGTITIKAFIDKNNIAITDTPDENTEWQKGREVFTTTEWNNLQGTGVSFQIKVEANEGVWVREMVKTAAQTINEVEEVVEIAGAKRYVGANPKNYVIFNNEQWRIIGVYGDSLKIIKATPLVEKQFWNNSSINEWNGNTLQLYLANTYYPTLSNDAKKMVDENATWNIGLATIDENAETTYSRALETQWNGKIGLIASYEYMYGALNGCWAARGTDYRTGCGSIDWLYPTTTSGSGHAWTMTGAYYSDDLINDALYINQYNGGIERISSSVAEYFVSPVVYLKSDVIITGGTGEIDGSEYLLEYTEL